MKWIDINEKLPPDNTTFGGETYLVTIKCDTWEHPETMVMEWECATIRGKNIKRWKWNGTIKIQGWKVTHWMELPNPAIIY